MKKILLAGIVLILLFASCSHYTCPTYDNGSGEQKYSGGKKSKTSKGLFPKDVQ